MALKAKFYAVWRGRKPGVYEDWKECEKQVKGFAGAGYRAFPTRELAEEAVRSGGLMRRRARSRSMHSSFARTMAGQAGLKREMRGGAGQAACHGVVNLLNPDPPGRRWR